MLVVLGSADQMNISFPLGSEPALLFILMPNGTVVSRLIPRYRLVNAPAVPEHDTVAPPACFSAPAADVTMQVHPPPGEYVGPPVRTMALAGDAATSSATTASITMLARTEPHRPARIGVVVPNARVCPAQIPHCGRSVVIATPPFTPRWALAPGGFSPRPVRSVIELQYCTRGPSPFHPFESADSAVSTLPAHAIGPVHDAPALSTYFSQARRIARLSC